MSAEAYVLTTADVYLAGHEMTRNALVLTRVERTLVTVALTLGLTRWIALRLLVSVLGLRVLLRARVLTLRAVFVGLLFNALIRRLSLLINPHVPSPSM